MGVHPRWHPLSVNSFNLLPLFSGGRISLPVT
jgi:hypothetical protein